MPTILNSDLEDHFQDVIDFLGYGNTSQVGRWATRLLKTPGRQYLLFLRYFTMEWWNDVEYDEHRIGHNWYSHFHMPPQQEQKLKHFQELKLPLRTQL